MLFPVEYAVAMKAIRVMVADRHPIMRIGLSTVVKDASDIELVGESDNATEALQLARSLTPDVLILGMNLPSSRSLEVVRQLYKGQVPIRVLVLSAFEEEQYVFEMLVYGAAAYLTKEEPPELIVGTIREVSSGTIGRLSQRVAARLTRPKQEFRTLRS